MYTVYCNQCTLHCKQCTLHCKRCTVYCVLCSVYTVYARSVWVCVHMFWLELSAYRHVMPTAPSFCTIINKQVTEACMHLRCEKCAIFYNISIKTKPYRQLFGEVRTQSGPGFDPSLVCTQNQYCMCSYSESIVTAGFTCAILYTSWVYSYTYRAELAVKGESKTVCRNMYP